MNKSNTRQKRSIGKESPLSKRPKLDFTIRTRESSKDGRNRESPNGYKGTNKEKMVKDMYYDNNKSNENIPTASDWDDDFSGDMLEKVCLMADLSQAMVNNESVSRELYKEKPEIEIFEGSKPPPSKAKTPQLSLEPSSDGEELEKLKLELGKLQEKLKTKEGEVHILRSQLKQNEDAKQAVALQNIKVIEDIQKKYSEKIITTEKELESTKTKLQFKDMEYKTLSERCRQLEYNISKSKLGEGQGENVKMFGGATQVITQKSQGNETDDDIMIVDVVEVKEAIPHFDLSPRVQHEGKCFAKNICPEFFNFIEETNIVPLYTFRSGSNYHRLDFDKREKYIWSDLPKQDVFIKDLYNLVTSLFSHESFSHKDLKETVERILESCGKILVHNKEVLFFLEKLLLQNSEFDDSDQSLLENEAEVRVVTVKDLLDGKRLNEEECGVEGRRALGLVYSLTKASEFAFDLVKNNVEFLKLLKDIVATIGNLRRPLRYTGILVGVTLLLQRILEEKGLEKEVLSLINEIVEEIIFARPKLDVLREVVNVLAEGKHHFEFLGGLCRKASVESCALYMDSKLKQAMFFTKEACPLKLLCMQIMGLASLPSSQSIRWDMTDCIIRWLNNSISNSNSKAIKWVEFNVAQEDRCFDVTKCLMHLLTLCLRDYTKRCPPHWGSDTDPKLENDRKRCSLISIIGHGAVLLKRILKGNQRLLNENAYSLRFAVLLKGLMPSKSDLCHKNHMSHMTSVQMEAISWITDLLGSDLKNQDCYVRQNISSVPDVEIFNALKISDESRIY